MREPSSSDLATITAARALHPRNMSIGTRLAVVTSDDRFCAPIEGTNQTTTGISAAREASRLCGVPIRQQWWPAYWWLTAALNWQWARTQQYDLLLYCVDAPCKHPDSGEERSPQWCKLLAIADALALGRYDAIFYLDSDAYWKDPIKSLADGLVREFAPDMATPIATNAAAAASSSQPASAYFGCNSPLNVCGFKWNFKAPNARYGSANSGVVLMRSGKETNAILWEWWHARNGAAKPNHLRKPGVCSDQAVLWRLWSDRPDLAASMRIMGRGSKKCLPVIGARRTQRFSPIAHITSTSPRYRNKSFSEAWAKTGRARHDRGWCVDLIRLKGVPSARRLFGRIDPANPLRKGWFASRAAV